MKLKTILIAGFLLVAVLGSVIGFVAIDTFRKVEAINSELQGIFVPNTILMIEMQKETNEVYSKGTEYIIIHRDYKEKAAEIKAEMKTAMAELKELGDKHFEYARYLDKEEKINAQQILDKIATFNYVMDGIINFIENYVGDTKDIDKKIAEIETNTVNSAYRILTDHLMEHRIEQKQELEDAELEVNAAQISGRNIIVITTIIIFVLALIIGYAISLLITKPIKIFKENAEKLGKGNLDTRIEISSKNEIGELATSFNRMADDLRLMSDAEREKSETLEKLTNELEIKVEERTKELADKVQKLDKSQESMLFMVEDLNRISKELKDKNIKLEKSQQSLSYLVEDVNESRAELDTSNIRLGASNKELEAFSYSVSHDLRAPLRSIDGFSKIILEDYSHALDKQGKHYLERVRAGSQKMGKLIDELLNLSRIGKKSINKEPVNLKALANNLYIMLKNDWKDRKINFVIHDCPVINCDPNLIQNVLINLFSNAIKFTKNETIAEIEFGCKQKGKQTTFFVKDNGVGFDMKYADKLFSPFQRLHHAGEFEGTGIGLAIVQRIIYRHRGKIWVESEINKGTIFYFIL